MNQQDQHKIARENRAEVRRAKTGLSSRDWGIVLGAIVIAALVLGFIYAANDTGVESALEPAAGSTMTTGNDDTAPMRGQSVPSNEDTTSGTEIPATGTSDTPSNQGTPEISPNPAD